MRLVAGRYELGMPLGAGGVATVYRALDPVERREVAVKIVPPPLALGASALGNEGLGEGAWSEGLPLPSRHEGHRGARASREPSRDESGHRAYTLARLRDEARALGRLRSRFVARVHDFGSDDAIGLYLVTDFVDGVHLDPPSLGRPLLPHEVLRVARGLLAGLGEAHALGIVHRDIKPSNVLVVRGRRALDEPRILDFGLAVDAQRPHEEPDDPALLLESTDDAGGPGAWVGAGTRAYMAPERLAGALGGPSSDVYAAGLVLFELLAVGPLFPDAAGDRESQLAARVARDPELGARVPPPLGDLLARMLRRDPWERFADATLALAAIGDLETAPAAGPLLTAPPPPMSAALPAPAASPEPAELESLRSASLAPVGKRLSRLSEDPARAVVEALSALDLAMLDTVARRGLASASAGAARAAVLALRSDLDLAAGLLEPLVAGSGLARAVAACLVVPRARRATRARLEVAASPTANFVADDWVERVDPELVAMLAALGVTLTSRDDSSEHAHRCRRAAARLPAGAHVAARTTVLLAERAAASLAGEISAGAALDAMSTLRADAPNSSPFHALVRGLLIGVTAFRAEETLAKEQLERAAKLAAEAGATLLEARALAAWGGLLIEVPHRLDQGLVVLERAATLLAHGDAPSLEHLAAHNRGAALVIQGRYLEAAPYLRRAREAAVGELPRDHEVLSRINEGFAYLCAEGREGASLGADDLSEARLAGCSPRVAAYAYVLRSLHAVLASGVPLAQAELRRAHAYASDGDEVGAEVYLFAEALSILYATLRGEELDLLARAGELRAAAEARGVVAFPWLSVLRATTSHLHDEGAREVARDTVDQLARLLLSS